MKALNAVNAQVQERIAQRDSSGYTAASIYAETDEIETRPGSRRISGK